MKPYRDDYHTLLRAFRAFDPEGKGYIEVEVSMGLMTMGPCGQQVLALQRARPHATVRSAAGVSGICT